MQSTNEKPAADNADGLPDFAKLGGKCGSENRLRADETQDEPIAVFRDGRVIGKVRQWRCGIFEAVSHSGASLGCWNTAHSAATALLMGARR